MKTWQVICHGTVREVYHVKADTAEEAMEQWHYGELIHSEAESVEAESAEETS